MCSRARTRRSALLCGYVAAVEERGDHVNIALNSSLPQLGDAELELSEIPDLLEKVEASMAAVTTSKPKRRRRK